MKASQATGRTCSNDTEDIFHPDSSSVTNSIFEAMNSDRAAAFADVTLISSDFVGFPAIRSLLAIRSSYFQTLFSSEFAELNSPKVTVSIAAPQLRELLEFLYTDDCTLIRTFRENNKERICNKRFRRSYEVNCREMLAILELAKAADKTLVERLVSRIEKLVMGVIQDIPHMASITLNQLSDGQRWRGKKLFSEALKICREYPSLALLETHDRCDVKHGFIHIGIRSAEDLFSGVFEQNTPQETLFEALVGWACGELRRSVPLNKLYCMSELVLQTRQEQAKRLALSFDVSRFKPAVLEEIVETSGLVKKEVLYRAYKMQALRLWEVCTRDLDERDYPWRYQDSYPSEG